MKLNALLSALALAALSATLAAPRAALAKGHGAQESYPMKPADFRKKVEARIDRVKAVIDKKLDGHNVSADRKAEIHKIIDDAAKEVRDAVTQASADGTVTEAEANQVKKLTIELRGKVRERMRAEKNGKGSKAKDKAQKPGDKPKAKSDASKKDAGDKPKSEPPKKDAGDDGAP
ncbi:MAG: hypothetical protein U0359_22575 [Byssovorax sp.]